MAKQRIIKTTFWTDTRVERLDPSEKLVYLYLLTNENVDLCGIYEISLRRVSFETWFEISMIDKIIQRFTKDKKVYYIDGWILISNFVKNQSLNPKVQKGIERSLSKVPWEILDEFYKLDRLSIDYIYSITPTGKVKYSIVYISSKKDIVDILENDIIENEKWWLKIMWELFIEKWFKIKQDKKELLLFIDWLKKKSKTTFWLSQTGDYLWDKTYNAIEDCMEYHKNDKTMISKQTHKSRVATWFGNIQKTFTSKK
jgi:hypothetical protein